MDDEWFGDFWLPIGGRLVTRDAARALVANRSIAILGTSTSRRLANTVGVHLMSDRFVSVAAAENEAVLTHGAHRFTNWANRLAGTYGSEVAAPKELSWHWLDRLDTMAARACASPPQIASNTTRGPNGVLVLTTDAGHVLGLNVSVASAANTTLRALGCACLSLHPTASLVWRTMPPVGGNKGLHGDADVRAQRIEGQTDENTCHTNLRILEYNQAILHGALCGTPHGEARRCLRDRLLVADFGRAMFRHDDGDDRNKMSAPPPSAAVAHYNHVARMIEAQLLYRALLGWPSAGPLASPSCEEEGQWWPDRNVRRPVCTPAHALGSTPYERNGNGKGNSAVSKT